MEMIKNADTQRYYQLDFKIKRYVDFYGLKKIKDLWENNPIKLIDGWVVAEDISESIDKICISDSSIHMERLVFPAFYIRNIDTGEIEICHKVCKIDGIRTFLIYGGDWDSLYDDKVYIRHLRMINKED